MIVELLTFFSGPAIPPDAPDTVGQVVQIYALGTLGIAVPAGLLAAGALALLMKFQNRRNAERREELRKEFNRGWTSTSDNHLT